MDNSSMDQPSSGSSYDWQKSNTSGSSSSEPEYKLVIEENVVEKIAAKAAQKIDGIVDMKGSLLSRVQEGLGGNDKTKGVDADVMDEDNARIDLDIIMEYGKSAPRVFEKIKKVVGEDLKEMTGLNVSELVVNVVDVMTHDEYSKNGSDSDKSQDNS